MTFHGARLEAVSDMSGRHVIVAEPPWIEPVLERGHRSVVLERTAVPHAFERGNLVVPRAATRLERRSRICSDRAARDVKAAEVPLWISKPSTGVSVLFVYSGGVWQLAQPSRVKTSLPWAASASNLFGFGGGFNE